MSIEAHNNSFFFQLGADLYLTDVSGRVGPEFKSATAQIRGRLIRFLNAG